MFRGKALGARICPGVSKDKSQNCKKIGFSTEIGHECENSRKFASSPSNDSATRSNIRMLASILSDFGGDCCLFEVYRPPCERRSRLLDLRDAHFGSLPNALELPDLQHGPRSGAAA